MAQQDLPPPPQATDPLLAKWLYTLWRRVLEAVTSITEASGVLTTDPRLSDARPASDVYAWAKASVKPSYTYTEVGAAPASHTHSGTDISSPVAEAFVATLVAISGQTGDLQQGDNGRCRVVSADITAPSGLTAGTIISIYNSTAATITITQGTGLTLRKNGTATTGDLGIAQYALATLWYASTTEAVLIGAT